jgi:dinuclear metal center YbgI/SA1388 family protein
MGKTIGLLAGNRKRHCVGNVVEAVEAIAPSWMASSDDAIGLQIGSARTPVRGVMVALDATLATIGEAHRKRCNLLVVHHPLFRHPVPDLESARPGAGAAVGAAKAGMAILVAHTNLDAAPGGVNDRLAAKAGLKDLEILSVGGIDPMRKLAVFVPASYAAKVRKAICGAGAGNIGRYSECSFATNGTGSFRGAAASRPFTGAPGRYEEVEEVRIEVPLLRSELPAVVAALRGSHPYEEPAFDIFHLEGGKPFGCGRTGVLPSATTVDRLARHLSHGNQFAGIQILGARGRRISRLAVWSGGSCPIDKVLEARVDALVTGELGYRGQLELAAHSVPAILLGHGPSEVVALPTFARRLRAALPGLRCLLSKTHVTCCASL